MAGHGDLRPRRVVDVEADAVAAELVVGGERTPGSGQLHAAAGYRWVDRADPEDRGIGTRSSLTRGGGVMSDIPGGGPVDRARPDDEPTINEAGADGFLVDGTDSFAVPGPIDVVPAEDVPESPAVSRTRLLVTAGAVAAGLAFVVAVGRGGAGDAGSTLRAEGTEAPGFAFSQWGADDGSVVLVVPEPADEDTLRRLEDGQVATDDSAGHEELGRHRGRRGPHVRRRVGDDVGYDVSIPSYPEYDDESFGDDDVDFPSYRPTLPRRTTSPQPPPGHPCAARDHPGGGDHDDARARAGGRDDDHPATGGGDDDHDVGTHDDADDTADHADHAGPGPGVGPGGPGSAGLPVGAARLGTRRWARRRRRRHAVPAVRHDLEPARRDDRGHDRGPGVRAGRRLPLRRRDRRRGLRDHGQRRHLRRAWGPGGRAGARGRARARRPCWP